MLVLMQFLLMIGVRVVVKVRAGRMTVLFRMGRMHMRVAVGMLVFMIMSMAMDDIAVAMRMFVAMAVGVAVLMAVLQLANFVAADAFVSQGQGIEVFVVLIGEKFCGGIILKDAALVHDQGALCQLADQIGVVTDQDAGL